VSTRNASIKPKPSSKLSKSARGVCRRWPAGHLLTTFIFTNIPAFEELSAFVFIDIPGSPPPVESRPFVFIDIPASSVKKIILFQDW
jgi:hypothetical protein